MLAPSDCWPDLPPGLPLPYRVPGSGRDLDLHAALVPNPLSTFFMRVQGDGLLGHGIHPGDLLVIDRSLPLQCGAVVVIAHRGQFLVRPLRRQGKGWLVLPLHRRHAAIAIPPDGIEASGLFGVVAHAVHGLRR